MPPQTGSPWCHDLAPVTVLVATGVRRQTVRRRVQRGAWQEPLPGVVCRTTGSLTTYQWFVVACMYGGEGAALSHGTAGSFWGFGPAPDRVHLTVPHGRHLRSSEAVHVHQSRRPFRPELVEDLLVTPRARTAVDTALHLRTSAAVDAFLGRVLQKGAVSLEQLTHETDLAPRRGSLLPRQSLAGLAMGSRSAGEARLLQLLRQAGLPIPELNAPLVTSLGTRYVDALWRRLGKGVEVDGQAFHLDAAAWRADLVRQNAIQMTGIVLLRIAARRLWTEPESVVAEIRAFLGITAP